MNSFQARPAGRRLRALGVLAAGALVSVSLAGCGGSSGAGGAALSKAAYSKQMSAIGAGFEADLGPLSTLKTAHQAQLVLTKLRGELAETVAKLRAIKAPAAIAGGARASDDRDGRVEQQLGPVIANLKTMGIKALRSVATLDAVKGIATAVAAINKAGYNIG